QADGGTLLLDEINSLNPMLQAKLLRVLQERTIRRIGDTKDKKVDVRIIATMNEDPADIVAENRIRKDLYYRLSVVSLFIPPLRERKEDIFPLVHIFIEKYNALFNMQVQGLTEEVITILYEHDWPGNVRELEHIIEGAMNLIIDEESIQTHHIPVRLRKKYQKEIVENRLDDSSNREGTTASKTLQDKMDIAEKVYIQQVLAENDHNVTKSAKLLGMSRQSLQYRLKKYGI